MMETVQTYTHTTKDQRTELVKKHLKLVDFLVDRMIPQVPSFLSREEITSAGMTGLIDAANRFDPSKGIMFKTFAEPRIRGAILDEVRKMDWFSRSMREKQSRLTHTILELEARLGRDPKEEEVAKAMNMTLENYRQLLSEISHLGCVSLHETLDDSSEGETFLDSLKDHNSLDPCDNIESKELTRELASYLEKLSEKERWVISLYYYEELTQKEIAEVLELSEGRISQLHSQALHKLKAKMKNKIPKE